MPWPIVFVLHWLLAVPLALIAGAAPDQFFYERLLYGTVLGGLVPCSAIIAGVLGFAVNRKLWHGTAVFILASADVVRNDSIRRGKPLDSGAIEQFAGSVCCGQCVRCTPWV
jgi:hypothetical protein